MFWNRNKEKETEPSALASVGRNMIEGKIKAFVVARSKILSISEIGGKTHIFSSGALDSLAFVDLVVFIESEFKIKLSDLTKVSMETLDSIEQIVELIVKGLSRQEKR